MRSRSRSKRDPRFTLLSNAPAEPGMQEHVTLLPPEARPHERGLSSSLPADLLEQAERAIYLLRQVCHSLFQPARA